MEWLKTLEWWHWWVLAIVLMILEALAPGAAFLWIGVAAAVVGVVFWVVPISWETQFILFSALSVLSIVGWLVYRKRRPVAESPLPMLNRRMERYVGTVLTLNNPIVNGTGQVHMKDTLWTVHGPDLPAGTKVKVVGYEGPVLKVEAV